MPTNPTKQVQREPSEEMVEATQADRDAAAAWVVQGYPSRSEQSAHGFAEDILAGRSDKGLLVQAFARHRQARSLSVEPLPENNIVRIANECEGWEPDELTKVKVSDIRVAAMAVNRIGLSACIPSLPVEASNTENENG